MTTGRRIADFNAEMDALERQAGLKPRNGAKQNADWRPRAWRDIPVEEDEPDASLPQTVISRSPAVLAAEGQELAPRTQAEIDREEGLETWRLAEEERLPPISPIAAIAEPIAGTLINPQMRERAIGGWLQGVGLGENRDAQPEGAASFPWDAVQGAARGFIEGDPESLLGNSERIGDWWNDDDNELSRPARMGRGLFEFDPDADRPLSGYGADVLEATTTGPWTEYERARQGLGYENARIGAITNNNDGPQLVDTGARNQYAGEAGAAGINAALNLGFGAADAVPLANWAARPTRAIGGADNVAEAAPQATRGIGQAEQLDELPVESAPDAGSVQGGSYPDAPIGGGLRRLGTDDAYIDYRAEPFAEEWFVTHQQIDDPNMRGQGRGVAAFEELIRRARESGVSAVRSDTRMLRDAEHVYEALRRRGYAVTQEGGGYRVSTAIPRGSEQWVDLYSGQRGDPNRPWRGHIWGARDRSIAQDYGPNVREMQGDISGAVTIRTLDDLRRALGPRADLAAELRGGDVFAHLDQPTVRDALREQGVRAVRVTDDMTPTQPTGNGNNWHESYLMLDESAIRTGPTTARDGGEGAQRVYRGGGQGADGQTWWSSSQDEADAFARLRGGGVSEGEISTDGFLVVDGRGRNWDRLPLPRDLAGAQVRRSKEWDHLIEPGEGGLATTDSIARAAREAGYPGVHFRNVAEETGVARDQFVAFDANPARPLPDGSTRRGGNTNGAIVGGIGGGAIGASLMGEAEAEDGGEDSGGWGLPAAGGALALGIGGALALRGRNVARGAERAKESLRTVRADTELTEDAVRSALVRMNPREISETAQRWGVDPHQPKTDIIDALTAEYMDDVRRGGTTAHPTGVFNVPEDVGQGWMLTQKHDGVTLTGGGERLNFASREEAMRYLSGAVDEGGDAIPLPAAAQAEARAPAGIGAERTGLDRLNDDTTRAFNALGDGDIPEAQAELDTRTDRFGMLAQDELAREDGSLADSQMFLREQDAWGRAADRLEQPDFRAPPRNRLNGALIGAGIGGATGATLLPQDVQAEDGSERGNGAILPVLAAGGIGALLGARGARSSVGMGARPIERATSREGAQSLTTPAGRIDFDIRPDGWHITGINLAENASDGAGVELYTRLMAEAEENGAQVLMGQRHAPGSRGIGGGLPEGSVSAETPESLTQPFTDSANATGTAGEQRRTRRPWSERELETAREMAARDETVRAIGAQLGRAPGDVSRRLRGIGNTPRAEWSGAPPRVGEPTEYRTQTMTRLLEEAERLAAENGGNLPTGYREILAERTRYESSSIPVYLTHMRNGDLGEEIAERASRVRGVGGYEGVNRSFVRERMSSLDGQPQVMFERLNGYRADKGLPPTTIATVYNEMNLARRALREAGELPDRTVVRPEPGSGVDPAWRGSNVRNKLARAAREAPDTQRTDLPRTGYHATIANVEGPLVDAPGGLGIGAYHTMDPEGLDDFFLKDDVTGEYLEGANIVPERLPALNRYVPLDELEQQTANLAMRRGVSMDDADAMLNLQDEITQRYKADGYVGVQNPDYAGGAGETVTWDASNRRSPSARMSAKNKGSSDPFAAAALTAGGGAIGGSLVLGDEAEAQDGLRPLPDGYDVQQGNWIEPWRDTTLPDGTEGKVRTQIGPDGRVHIIAARTRPDGIDYVGEVGPNYQPGAIPAPGIGAAPTQAEPEAPAPDEGEESRFPTMDEMRLPLALAVGIGGRQVLRGAGVRPAAAELIAAGGAGGVSSAIDPDDPAGAIGAALLNPLAGRVFDESWRATRGVADSMETAIDRINPMTGRDRRSTVRGIEFDPQYRAPGIGEVASRNSEQALRGEELQREMAQRAIGESQVRRTAEANPEAVRRIGEDEARFDVPGTGRPLFGKPPRAPRQPLPPLAERVADSGSTGALRGVKPAVVREIADDLGMPSEGRSVADLKRALVLAFRGMSKDQIITLLERYGVTAAALTAGGIGASMMAPSQADAMAQ